MSCANMRAANFFDKLAIAGSSLCIVHCLALPVIIALLPALSEWLDLSEAFHFWFLLVALPLSGFVLWQHSLRRKRPLPFALGMTALAIMAMALTLEGSSLEPVVTTFGGVMLAWAHVLNLRGRASCHK